MIFSYFNSFAVCKNISVLIKINVVIYTDFSDLINCATFSAVPSEINYNNKTYAAFTFSRMTFNRMKLSIMTLRIMTLRRMTFRGKKFLKNYIQKN
jgi:hypothetical protein